MGPPFLPGAWILPGVRLLEKGFVPAETWWCLLPVPH